jgi:hypothetical protein
VLLFIEIGFESYVICWAWTRGLLWRLRLDPERAWVHRPDLRTWRTPRLSTWLHSAPPRALDRRSARRGGLSRVIHNQIEIGSHPQGCGAPIWFRRDAMRSDDSIEILLPRSFFRSSSSR